MNNTTNGIGVNIRVTKDINLGNQAIMEDMCMVAFHQSKDTDEFEYAIFGAFDGHNGRAAALYACDNLAKNIICNQSFPSVNDDVMLKIIKEAFTATHFDIMRKQVESFRAGNLTGFPSKSGTTATIVLLMSGKIYTGNVGDSKLVLGIEQEGEEAWLAQQLTSDQTLETKEEEKKRITDTEGKAAKRRSARARAAGESGPDPEQGPETGTQSVSANAVLYRSVPFLTVARSLGNFWSYDGETNKFIARIIPDPDVRVIPIDVAKHRCLILGTSGIWGMMSPTAAVATIRHVEARNRERQIPPKPWMSASRRLVERALFKWKKAKRNAENLSAVTVMIDKRGPCLTLPALFGDEDDNLNLVKSEIYFTAGTRKEEINFGVKLSDTTVEIGGQLLSEPDRGTNNRCWMPEEEVTAQDMVNNVFSVECQVEDSVE